MRLGRLSAFASMVVCLIAGLSRADSDPTTVTIDGKIVEGAAYLREYSVYVPKPEDKTQDRAANHAIVEKFFRLPIGEQRASLYAKDGIKQIPMNGWSWIGLANQLKNNQQNIELFPGWHWTKVQIWDTTDPSVFWVEAEGSTGPQAATSYSNHYVCQLVIRDAKIELFREFGTPTKLSN